MKVNKETIWHFTCKSCYGWWSIANSDAWVPTKLYCPHCGKQRTNDNDNKKVEWSDEVKGPDKL